MVSLRVERRDGGRMVLRDVLHSHVGFFRVYKTYSPTPSPPGHWTGLPVFLDPRTQVGVGIRDTGTG